MMKRNQDLYISYSKNPHNRTCVLGVQADVVLIYRVFFAKLA